MPLNAQAKQGMGRLSKHCLEMLMEAVSDRQARVDKAKDEYLARLEEEENERKKQEEKDRMRKIEVR